MFELKKILSAFLMPLPAFLILGFVGLLFVMFSRYRKFGCSCTFLALSGLLIASFQPFSSALLMPLERQYKPFVSTNQPIDYVMVLGSGHIIDSAFPLTSELSRNGMMRLVEGIRILRTYPNAKLILSGYSAGSPTSNARVMGNIAASLGIEKSDIILLEGAKDTNQEALQVSKLVKGKNLVLVTSASHMKRALDEFHLSGLKPIPAPTNFLASNNIHQNYDRFAPQPKYLEQTTNYWHETLGKWWFSIRSNWFSDIKDAENGSGSATVL